MDEAGVVRPVRELDGKPVHQIILGGDSGASLRDMLAAAALLKSKKVPPKLDFLIAPPSRQVLEVLAKSGALVDLIATGARLVEPDYRIISAELYPPPPGGVSLRTFDPEPGCLRTTLRRRFRPRRSPTPSRRPRRRPRSFKRPVRVTVPRALPTDDVLVVRKTKSKGKATAKSVPPTRSPCSRARMDRNLDARAFAGLRAPDKPTALTPVDARRGPVGRRSRRDLAPNLRAVIATYIRAAPCRSSRARHLASPPTATR